MPENVEEADDAHLACVMHKPHPFTGEQIAADAEGLDPRVEPFQLTENFGGVKISGRLSGDDGKFHRSGNGYIAQARTIPPRKSEKKTRRKKRMRSARVSFQSSAKNTPVATA
jgi:hypothetical protein